MKASVKELEGHLLASIPGLAPCLAEARLEHEEEPQSEYWLFSYVVRPYLQGLLERRAESELGSAWQVLEDIVARAKPAVRNELFVMMEELDLHHFYRFMGQSTRSHWLEVLAWYPSQRNRTTAMNAHVDRAAFRSRWAEEVDRIGGFECLTEAEEARITAALWKEFRIEGITRVQD